MCSILAMSILLYRCTIGTLTKKAKNLDGNDPVMMCVVLKNTESNIRQNSKCTASYLPSYKPSMLDEYDMQDTAGESREKLLPIIILWTPIYGPAQRPSG